MRFSSNSKIQESSFKRDVVSLKSQSFPRITVPVEPVTAFIKLALSISVPVSGVRDSS